MPWWWISERVSHQLRQWCSAIDEEVGKRDEEELVDPSETDRECSNGKPEIECNISSNNSHSSAAEEVEVRDGGEEGSTKQEVMKKKGYKRNSSYYLQDNGERVVAKE